MFLRTVAGHDGSEAELDPQEVKAKEAEPPAPPVPWLKWGQLLRLGWSKERMPDFGPGLVSASLRCDCTARVSYCTSCTSMFPQSHQSPGLQAGYASQHFPSNPNVCRDPQGFALNCRTPQHLRRLLGFRWATPRGVASTAKEVLSASPASVRALDRPGQAAASGAAQAAPGGGSQGAEPHRSQGGSVALLLANFEANSFCKNQVLGSTRVAVCGLKKNK